MSHPSTFKQRAWRAVAIFDDRPDGLVYLGCSSTQVRANFGQAFIEVFDDEERNHVRSISLQRWHGAPDTGRWLHQTNLIVPIMVRLVRGDEGVLSPRGQDNVPIVPTPRLGVGNPEDRVANGVEPQQHLRAHKLLERSALAAEKSCSTPIEENRLANSTISTDSPNNDSHSQSTTRKEQHTGIGHHSAIRIGIYGQDASEAGELHGSGLWYAGIASALTSAEATPVWLNDAKRHNWGDALDGIAGVVLIGHDSHARYNVAQAESLVLWCQEHKFPLMGIDHGLHTINTAYGGTVHFNLPRNLPKARQHRHPPERGLRHAINVLPDTKLAALYGEGEVVVNSEHRRAVACVARGFRVGAQALDGVIEEIEAENDWFALGVQWNPTSNTASGLDIQLFRGLVDACRPTEEMGYWKAAE